MVFPLESKTLLSPFRHFPHPFGPTMAVTPGSKRNSVFSANDLNPYTSSFLNIILSPLIN